MPDKDRQHLKLLSVFHYIVGGLLFVFSFFPVLYVIMGWMMITAPGSFEGDMAPHHGDDITMVITVGWFLAILGIFLILLGWVGAIAILYAGRSLARQKHYTYCAVVAGVECLFVPFGTVLGIFTLIVLLREPVKALFDQNAAA